MQNEDEIPILKLQVALVFKEYNAWKELYQENQNIF